MLEFIHALYIYILSFESISPTIKSNDPIIPHIEINK